MSSHPPGDRWMVKSTALPSGSTCGRRWLSSPFAGSGVVNASGVPPASATCHRPPPPWFAKMIRPFGPQLIPAGSAVRQRVTTGPPASGTFFSSPRASAADAVRASLPETDPLPIGREERALGPLRSLDRRRLQSIHPPHIQLPRSALAAAAPAAGGRDASSAPSGGAPMNASDWPSGDNAMAERKGRALGKSSVRAIWLAGDTPTSTRATARGAVLPCQAPGAKRGEGRRHHDGERDSDHPPPVQRTCERCWCRDIGRSGTRILDGDAQACRRPASGGAAPCAGNAAAACGSPAGWLTAGDPKSGSPRTIEGQRVGRAVSLECDRASEHFVQDAPEGPDVGGLRDRRCPSPAPATCRRRCRG